MKYITVILVQIDSDEYDDVHSINDVQELVNDMMHGEVDWPDNKRVHLITQEVK